MAKRAKGKKSYAISDISGFKVPYRVILLPKGWRSKIFEIELVRIISRDGQRVSGAENS